MWCILQSVDSTGTRFGKFLAHGQAHMEQMDKWTWHFTTMSLENSIEFEAENINPAASEICSLQSSICPSDCPYVIYNVISQLSAGAVW